MNWDILFCIAALFLFGCQKEEIKGDILIKGGLVYSGDNQLPEHADLIIHGDSIIWMGNGSSISAKVDTFIDATNMVVTAGFIDIHAHGNPLETPYFSNFLAMGVTSIALGMDGSSIPVSSLKKWISSVDSIRPGVNVLPFVGHGTLRSNAAGNETQLDKSQLTRMGMELRGAFDQGVWGLSMGLEYLPGQYADSVELIHLAKIVGENNALITSHVRNEDDEAIEASLREMQTLQNFCNVNISHLKVVYGKGKDRADSILEFFSANKNDQFQFTADLYPYTASYTGIGIVFPNWAKNPKSYEQVKARRGEELAAHLKRRVTLRNGPEATLFGSGPYKGRTLQSVAAEYQLPFEIVLRDIIGPYGASAAYFVMNDDLQKELFKNDLVVVASDGSPTMYHPRGHGTFSKVLQEYVVGELLVTLEKAINKMTGKPSQILGLEGRGTLKIGNKADILIFDPQAIRSNASFENPHELSTGIEIVIVNGRIAYITGEFKDRSGRVLLRKRD